MEKRVESEAMSVAYRTETKCYFRCFTVITPFPKVLLVNRVVSDHGMFVPYINTIIMLFLINSISISICTEMHACDHLLCQFSLLCLEMIGSEDCPSLPGFYINSNDKVLCHVSWDYVRLRGKQRAIATSLKKVDICHLSCRTYGYSLMPNWYVSCIC